MTTQEFWQNAMVRAVLTALAVGALAALAPLVPILAGGVMPGRDALFASLAFGLGGVGSVIVSLLSRFVGDKNNGSFTS
ncbi:MAG: hypothetical protein WCN81_00040 [Actinomycetes bacterium]